MGQQHPLAGFLEAVKAGDVDLVQGMLDDEPGLLDPRTPAGVSVLLLALYHGHQALADMLAERDGSLDLCESAALGVVERVDQLLQQRPGQVDRYAPDGYTPLGLGSYFGHLPVVKLLLERGADAYRAARNTMAATPLHSAIAGSHLEIARLLLEHGADADVEESGGFTPLHLAAEAGSVPMVELLLAHGARQMAAENGQTPRDLADKGGHSDVVELLVEP